MAVGNHAYMLQESSINHRNHSTAFVGTGFVRFDCISGRDADFYAYFNKIPAVLTSHTKYNAKAEHHRNLLA